MITMIVDYKGPKSFQTYKFKDIEDGFLSKLDEIHADYAAIDGVRICSDKEWTAKSTSSQSAVQTARIWVKRQHGSSIY